jgi:hypothetical protein
MADYKKDVLEGVRVSGGVVAALRLAAVGRPSALPVGMDRLIDALRRSDPVGDWSRVELRLGQGLRPDGTPTGGYYDGIPLTDEVCWALEGAVAVMEAYGFPLLVPGLVAVAVLFDRASSLAEPSDARIDARMALAAVLEDVLGGDLPDLAGVLGPGSVRRCARELDALDRPEVEAPLALLHEAAELEGDGRDPGACGLLVAALGGDDRLDRLRGHVGLVADDCRSPELEGIPDESAVDVFDWAARERGSQRRVDLVYATLMSPSWRVWELLGLHGVRPLDFAAAIALDDPDRPVGLVGGVRDDLARLARRALWLWAAYTLVRQRDVTALALLAVPKAWARDIPAVVSLAAAGLTVAWWGWVPGGVVLAMAVLAACTARSERRSLRTLLGATVPGPVHRRAIRLAGRGGLALASYTARTWTSERQEARK